MARIFNTPIDLTGLELLNARLQNLATAPSSPGLGRAYYDTTLGYARIYSATGWIDITTAASGYSDEQAQDAIAAMISAGTQSGLSVSYNDAGNAISFTVPADGAAGTATLRTLGTGAAQAAAGNDARFTDTRTPTAGSVVNASVAGNAAISSDKLADGATNGVYTLAERTKLAGIATGATVYNDTMARANRLDQFAAPTAAVNMGAQKITNGADPTAATDFATKQYVDATATGLDVKASVRVATTANITLSGTQTIDGVAVVVGDRVLAKNQTTASANGIYVVAAGAWARSADADSNAEVTSGLFTFVSEGTINADTGWILSTNDAIVLGTTSLTFTQFSGAGSVGAGNGLTQTGNTLDVGAGTGITVAADSVGIDTAVVTRKANFNVGDGAATAYNLVHNFGTRDVQVRLYRNSTPWDTIEADETRPDVNTVTVTFATAPAANAYRAVVQG
jgi:hypothetical protein